MKKKLFCIIMACFLFVGVPVKGYAASLSPLVFGMSEDVVLAFLASLLGVSAKETINTYADLTAYDNDLRLGFTEYMAGSATALQVAEWIQEVVVGNIDKSSVIWQKFYEYCIDNYTVSDGTGASINSSGGIGNYNFTFYPDTNVHSLDNGNGNYSEWIGNVIKYGTYQYMFASSNSSQIYRFKRYENNVAVSDIPVTNGISYTYDGRTVYYTTMQNAGLLPEMEVFNYNSTDLAKVAWLMVYGDAVISSANVGVISGVFDSVLSSQEVEELIDGTSVLQLYNPAVAQNGLQIVPDPDDPNDIVVPAMLTADWYNFLQQFGPSGASQFVAAYNALNAVEGISTGAIDGIYKNLGIASAISTAAQAAQGTLTLADNNVFPQVSTIADAVTGVIPGALTPEVPDNGIDNESDQGLYKLPDLKDFFPFCIPFDLIDLLSCFIAEPETPQFVIALSTGEDTVTGQMDLHVWDNIASVLRGLELMAFTVGLILITRNIIRG